MRLNNKPAAYLIIWILISSAVVVCAAEIPVSPPNPVVDLAGIIDGSTRAKLNGYLRELEQKSS